MTSFQDWKTNGNMMTLPSESEKYMQEEFIKWAKAHEIADEELSIYKVCWELAYDLGFNDGYHV